MNVFELFGSEKPRKNLKESSEITIVYEKADMCKVCGQTPCNCTHVSEGTVDRRIARTQALIQDYHKRAKASANDIKKNHYLAMADQLTAELQSLIDDANEHERASNEIAQHDAESSRVWESYDDYDDSWDYRDEIASLENQIKYSKSAALTHTLYKQLDQLKREHGVEIDDDEYYGDFDDEGHRIDDEGNRIDNFGNIIEQDVEEARRANTAAARAELGNRPRKPGLSPAEQDKAKADSDEAWERLMAYADEQKKKEQGLNEFAPGNSGGESGRWYTDDDMTNIVGDGWWQDLDISGDVSKQEMINEAQAWLLDNGYRVQVLNVKVNDDDCEWFIEGSFQNNRFAKKGMAESQLNEYLVKAGMPVEDVLTLNLFQDFDPVEGCAAQFPEFAQDPTWKQVVRKYSRIANTLEKQILALDQPLTHSQAEEIEDVWYDGSDAYDDMEIKYLVDVYNRQIAVIEAIIAGELQDDDEEFGEGETQVNEFAPGNNDNGGEEDALFRFAQMWYSAPDVATQQKVEQALAKAGWEIGELESEEGGAYVMRVGDNEGDSYIGWSEEQLADISEGATKTDDYVDPEEADYGDEYQAMVKRVGQKAKQQELAKKHNDEDLTESFLYAMKKAGYDII